MTDQAIAMRGPQEVALSAYPKSQVDLMVAAIMPAIQSGTDPAVLREQIGLMKDLMAMKAKENFEGAMALFRAAVPAVMKTAKVANLYRYAPLDSVVLQVRDALQAQGFTWSFDQDPAPSGSVTGVCIVSHSGHSERRAVTLPIAGGNSAGDATKNAAGALSFAQRRAFQNAFGIVVQGDDTDAQLRASVPNWAKDQGKLKKTAPEATGAQGDPLKEARKKLWRVLSPVRGDDTTWAAAQGWLQSVKILPMGQTVTGLASVEDIDRITAFAEVKLSELGGVK